MALGALQWKTTPIEAMYARYIYIIWNTLTSGGENELKEKVSITEERWVWDRNCNCGLTQIKYYILTFLYTLFFFFFSFSFFQFCGRYSLWTWQKARLGLMPRALCVSGYYCLTYSSNFIPSSVHIPLPTLHPHPPEQWTGHQITWHI